MPVPGQMGKQLYITFSGPQSPHINRSSATLILIPPHPHLLPNTLGNHRKEIHSQAGRGSGDSQAKSRGGCDPAAAGWAPVNTDVCLSNGLLGY